MPKLQPRTLLLLVFFMTAVVAPRAPLTRVDVNDEIADTPLELLSASGTGGIVDQLSGLLQDHIPVLTTDLASAADDLAAFWRSLRHSDVDHDAYGLNSRSATTRPSSSITLDAAHLHHGNDVRGLHGRDTTGNKDASVGDDELTTGQLQAILRGNFGSEGHGDQSRPGTAELGSAELNGQHMGRWHSAASSPPFAHERARRLESARQVAAAIDELAAASSASSGAASSTERRPRRASTSALAPACNGVGILFRRRAQRSSAMNGSTATPVYEDVDACACPVDYVGPACEQPLHYACAVMVSDPVYHLCAASNGAGFTQPPSSAAPPSSGDHSDTQLLQPAVLLASDPLAWLAGDGSGAASADRFLGLPFSSQPGSRSEADASIPAPPDPPPPAGIDAQRHQGAYRGYSPSLSGDPPCLFLNRKTVNAAAASGQRLLLPLRVTCGWEWANVSSVLSSGEVMSDPRGRLYAHKPRASANTQPVEAALQSYVPPIVPSIVALDNGANSAGGGGGDANQSEATLVPLRQAAVFRCNGTLMTRAWVDATIPAFYPRSNRTSQVRDGHLPPYYGLPCVEQQLRYVVAPQYEHPSDDLAWMPVLGLDVPFGLSKQPQGVLDASGATLGIRVRAVSPVRLSDASLMVVHPIAIPAITTGVNGTENVDSSLSKAAGDVLTGRTDIIVDLGAASDWASQSTAAHMWPGGRMSVEAKVVMLPLGVAAAASPVAADGGLDDTGADALALAAALVDSFASPHPAHPLMVLTNIHVITIDDSSYKEPTMTPASVKVRSLVVVIAVPVSLVLLVVYLVLYWRRRAQKRQNEEAEGRKKDQ